MGAHDAPTPHDSGGQSLAARLAALVNSAIAGAEDPRTLAVTVLNCAPAAQGGRIDLYPRLIDEAASYELVDDCGAPVPHGWIGEPGCAPRVVTLPGAELADLPAALARVLASLPPGLDASELSVWTSGKTVHLEASAGAGDAIDPWELENAAILAVDLATRAACARACITVHLAASMHLAVAVPVTPACSYRTFLLRPRAKAPKVKGSRMATLDMLPLELGNPEPLNRSPGVGNLRSHAGLCVEGVLPHAGPLLSVRPRDVVLDAFVEEHDGRCALVRVSNRCRLARTAEIDWKLPARSVEVLEAGGKRIRVIRSGGSCSGLEAEMPALECLLFRIEWA